MTDKSYSGKIYKLYIDGVEDMVYIGSTKQKVEARIQGHKNKYKEYKNGKYHYVSSFALFEYIEDNNGCNLCYDIIEEFDKITKRELEIIEGQYIKSFKCVNKVIAGRNKKEYYQDHKGGN
jgi:hypothetical protein